MVIDPACIKLAKFVGFKAVRLTFDWPDYEGKQPQIRWDISSPDGSPLFHPEGPAKTEAIAWERYCPNFKISMDLMIKWVYPVLRNRGLWDTFFRLWDNRTWGRLEIPKDKKFEPLDVTEFIHSLSGQIVTANRVLSNTNDVEN